MHNYTLNDYFRHEKDSWDKSEYYQGQILTMPGTTGNHSLICLNVAINLLKCSKIQKNCNIYE